MARERLIIALTGAVLVLCSVFYFVHVDHVFDAARRSESPLLDWYDAIRRPTSEVGDHEDGDHVLGVGKADITGPVVEINMMGYADPKQLGSGVKQRLYSRAFIIGSTTDPAERIVYLVLDTQSGDTAIRYGILQGLAGLGKEYAMYGAQNIAVTGTHSHSGPGAWLNYLLPQITSKGFDRQSYEAIVKGALLSIQRAHVALQLGSLELVSGEIYDANVNRSPYAYLANPLEERKKYKYDVDKTMTLLRFKRARDGSYMGALNWFPVHGTSMLGNNTLITGDNKGVAAELMERAFMMDGEASFVAGFSQANVGDTSPNILGAYCEDGTGSMCSFERSLCAKNRSEECHGRGPYFGLNDGGARSCFEIGKRQYEGALKLMANEGERLQGPIRSLHTYRDFSNLTFTLGNGSLASTCSAALGYSFAAGTTDGPGAFDFKQNSRNADANPLWKVVSSAVHSPSKEQVACQAPKPILLDVGATKTPYQWTPNIVDIQLMRVGQLFIIVSPGEATTISGRRWKEAIGSAARAMDQDTSTRAPTVVLGGPANSYTHYIATEEEYGIQRYEGASTLYGPHTLNAYINITTSLIGHLSASASFKQILDPGPQPPIHVNRSLSFIQGVVFDRPGFFQHYGQALKDVEPPARRVYRSGQRVSATFVGANPRNNLRLEGTFTRVEKARASDQTAATEDELKQRQDSELVWEPFLTDADWSLTYHWRRVNKVTGTSEVDLGWDIDDKVPSGLYRFTYFGDARKIGSGDIEAFVGHSGPLQVAND